ncbi:MAG: ABC transporter permease [Flavobacteriales bacterium]|jgi:peptide/nickel transport system permease protein|nr:ABC transporter permease [Flavobacteriales bacterium]
MLKKLSHSLVTLFGVLCLVFFLFNIMPGDPAQMMLGQHQNEKQLQDIRQKYGLDLPLHKQFLFWINDLSPISYHHQENEHLVHYWTEEKYAGTIIPLGKQKAIALKKPYLRESFQKKGKKVSDIMLPKIFNTFILACFSILIAFILGVLLGIFLQKSNNKILNNLIEIFTMTGMALPSFFASILIAWFFGFYLSEYTTLNMIGSLYEMDDYGSGKYLQLKNLILPGITLGIRPLAVISQLTKTSLEQVMQEDYIRTAFSKGLTKSQVLWRHALKNALNPIITATSGWFASLLAGAVFVEYIFAWDGIGKLLVESLETLDLPLIIGIVLFIALVFIMINIFVDLIYRALDPRVKNT